MLAVERRIKQLYFVWWMKRGPIGVLSICLGSLVGFTFLMDLCNGKMSEEKFLVQLAFRYSCRVALVRVHLLVLLLVPPTKMRHQKSSWALRTQTLYSTLKHDQTDRVPKTARPGRAPWKQGSTELENVLGLPTPWTPTLTLPLPAAAGIFQVPWEVEEQGEQVRWSPHHVSFMLMWKNHGAVGEMASSSFFCVCSAFRMVLFMADLPVAGASSRGRISFSGCPTCSTLSSNFALISPGEYIRLAFATPFGHPGRLCWCRPPCTKDSPPDFFSERAAEGSGR